jgi:hypothetical protein
LDVDGWQGDAIPISDQVKQKDSSSRLEASRREPSTVPQALIPHALKQQQLWSMLWTVAPAVADRRSCGLIGAEAV